jgi:hypothetical protein
MREPLSWSRALATADEALAAERVERMQEQLEEAVVAALGVVAL